MDVKQLGRGFFSCGLWNPASREVKIVAFPHLPDQRTRIPGGFGFDVVGFGFDPVSNDYKIVAIIPVKSDIVLLYMVYSLSTDFWKRVCQPSLLGINATVRCPGMDACFNGVHYWIANLLNNEYDPKIFRILSYNFSTEVFRFSDPPQGALPPVGYNSDKVMWNIGLHNESIALFFIRTAGEASVDIWTATEFEDGDFGAPLAWQCLISIKPIIERLGSWVGAQRMNGDLLFSMFDCELSLYNPTTGQFRRMGINFDICFGYVESLFPLSRRVVVLT
ncbi:F-box/kelch-repeat protein At3g06240-like isoform X2 [Chenopodium quinoa]|nr:F-box/kelch-repeat protein At3g06240-like isoform X2 [Chenopodium quinoa]